MSKWKLEQWCVHATARIRYGPDRKEVYKELREHADERFDHFRAQGNSEEDAVDRTLNAMGDATEVAVMLEKVHRPFWGYLYSTAKYIVLILAITCLCQLLGKAWENMYEYPTPSGNYWSDDYVGGDRRVLNIQSGTSITCDGYTVTLTQASMWRTWLEEGDHDTMEHLYFQLEVTNPRPWAKAAEIMNWIWAEDSQGTHYYCYAEQLSSDHDCVLYGNRYETGPFTTVYEMHIGWRIPEGTEWIDLRYTRDGRDWTIRIDLTGGKEE